MEFIEILGLPPGPLEKMKMAEKAIQNPENMDVHFFQKWRFIGALMVRHRASNRKMDKIAIWHIFNGGCAARPSASRARQISAKIVSVLV